MLRTLKKSGGLLMAWAASLSSFLGVASNSPAAAVPPSASPWADSRPFRQTIWTTEQGLPNNTIQALLQTRDGYLWIGTAGGLVRFDGLTFTVFRRPTHPGMGNDDCRLLAEATDGSLWIATRDGLLRFFAGEFQRITTKDGLPDHDLRALGASRHGEVWIGSLRGLACWRDGQLRHYGREHGLNNEEIFALGEDTQGRLWVCNARGFQLFDRAGERFVPYPLVEQRFVHVTAVRDANDLWAFEDDKRVPPSLQRWHDGQWTVFPLPGPAELTGYSRCVVLDRENSVWTSAGKFGLDRFRDGAFTRFTAADGLSDSWVISFCEDREGNLWIGTDYGLNRWQPRRIRAYSARDGLLDDNTWTLCEARDGSVWIGTDGGLSQFKEGRFTNYTERDGLARNSVRALAEDAEGGLWIGTGGGGLTVLRNGAFTNISLPGALSGNKIRVLHRGRDGAMWVGSELGLHRFQNRQWTRWTRADGLPHNDVRAIRDTRDGALWIGTFGGGVCAFGVPPLGGQALASPETAGTRSTAQDSPNSDRLKPGLQTFTTTNGLANNFAWAFHEDADGALWIGTEGGLSRWEDGRFFSFTTEHGLLENIINEILEDDSGHLWLSGEEGIYRIPRRELEDVAAGRARKANAATFGAADGLLSLETNGQKSQPAGCKTRAGKLWFPTTKGVVMIDPHAGVLNEVPPPVVIEQVRADEETIFGDGYHSNNSDFGFRISDLRLPPGRARVLEFHYTANSFVAPEHVRFRYQLEGHDRDWTDAGTRRVAYYTSLRPGDYRFRVIACNNHGVWNETGASFAFSLAPHFYETLWFYALCAAGVLSAVLGVHQWRVNQVRTIQALRQQLAVAQERTRIAGDIHDDLGASLTQIGLLTELAARDLAREHPAQPHVANAASVAKELRQSVDEIVWAADPQNDTLRSLLAYLRTYASDFLSAGGLGVRFDFPESVPGLSLTAEQRHHVFLIVKEALHNTVQHAAAKEVRFTVILDRAQLAVTLADNGRGFDIAAAQGTGHGLASMARRVQALGGKLSVSSQPGCGTTIQFDAPLG